MENQTSRRRITENVDNRQIVINAVKNFEPQKEKNAGRKGGRKEEQKGGDNQMRGKTGGKKQRCAEKRSRI
jgi:hypothetical protein